MSKKILLLAGAAALLAAAGAAFLASGSSGPRVFREDYLYSVVRGDLRYDFDPAWRNETLSRRGEDGIWRPLEKPDPAALDELRAVLLREGKFESLEKIPEEGKEERDSLKGLGYL